MTLDQVADTVNHTRMKKKKKLLQSGGQKLFEPTTSSTDEQNNCQDPPTKKKKHISERVQTENEEVRTFNGIQFPGSSEQSDGLSEIPKKKKKKKKTLKSYDQESITIEPKTPTDDQQSCQDQPKKKKKSKSERVQTENEEIPKKKKKKEKGVDALCDIESSLKINRQVWRGETVLTEMHVNKNLESAPTTLRKSKKRKRATSCKSDGQESVTIESETTAADENVSTEIKERDTLPSSTKRQPGSHERRRKKKRQSGKDQVEDEEETRGDSGLILRKRGEKERVFFNKKKKKTKEGSRLHVKGGGDARGKVLECVPDENPSAADKKRVKGKRKRSVQSDGQESVTGKPRSSTTDENASVENSEMVTDSVTDQNQQISQKRNRRRQRRKKKLMNNNDQVGEESRRVSSENSEELTDIPKKKKKKKTEDGRLNDAEKGAGLEENAQAGRGENVLTMQSNEAISNDDNLEIAFTVLKKKRKKKKRKQIVEPTNEESVEPRTTDEDVLVEEAERLTLPLSEQNGRKKKKKRANGQIEKEELRPVNGSILQASDEHLEGLTGITKKKKKTKKSVELNEIANAGRGESVLTEMQMNEPVSNDDNLEVKKRKRKKKRKQSVESIDQESINVEPQTTDEDLLIEENGLLKKKIIPSGQTEDEGELSTVNGLLGEITKKKKKKKKKATHATRDNWKLISQSDDNSVSEYSPNEVGQDSESDATDGETSEDITKKQNKKKKKKKKMATHATQDNSDQLNLKDNDNSVSEYSCNEASQDSESEATDGESSSSDLSSDCDREDFRKLDISSLPWLVKSERGFFRQETIEDCPVLHMRNHYYKKEREALRKQGHTVVEGRWSGLEEARMRKNLEKFCKAYGIENHLILLIPSRFGLVQEVRRFLKSTKMLVKLAEGIHRTLNTVYIRAFKLFDPWHLGRER
ncbi:titin homolog isoform X2 [Asterias rubens]|uniref:titin homolog isoform X2 n=1 Tax=Asterias rubens TaxID=7604 RepID=UPI0014550A55|nr:titin homolog isoform X2 [Asterias rubens]